MVHTSSTANVGAKIIAFSGAPGTGKTEAVFNLAKRLKADGKRVKPLITYFKRRAEYGLTYRDTIANGFCNQVNVELEALSRDFDYIITNHTVVDWVTTALAANHITLYSAMAPMAQAHLDHYHTISINPVQIRRPFGLGPLAAAVAGTYQFILIETYKKMGVVIDGDGRASINDLVTELHAPDTNSEWVRSEHAKILEGFQAVTIN